VGPVGATLVFDQLGHGVPFLIAAWSSRHRRRMHSGATHQPVGNRLRRLLSGHDPRRRCRARRSHWFHDSRTLPAEVGVVITVDQLRPDYLNRWKTQLTAGGAAPDEGRVFTDGYQDHAITETAPVTRRFFRAWPAHTGIMRNSQACRIRLRAHRHEWPGASPRPLSRTTLVDCSRHRIRTPRLSVSRKDRGAILPIGQAKEQSTVSVGHLHDEQVLLRHAAGVVLSFNARISVQSGEHHLDAAVADSAL